MRLLFVAFLAVAAYTLWSAVTLVQPGERAVIRRFGQILDEKPGPGMHVGLPWGMDRIDRVAVGRVRTVTVGLVKEEDDESVVPVGQWMTGDHNLVNVQATIHYRVVEDQVEQFVQQQNRVDDLVARAAESSLSEWVASRGVDEILLRGKVLVPAWLVGQVQQRIARQELGVHIESASITLLHPPSQVKARFDEVGQEQTRIRTQINQAEQEADRKRREAESEKFRIAAETRRYGREQELSAQAEAENFTRRLEQYRRLARDNPSYLQTLWTDGMTRLYARMRETGRIDILDHYLSGEGLNITQFPLLPKKR